MKRLNNCCWDYVTNNIDGGSRTQRCPFRKSFRSRAKFFLRWRCWPTAAFWETSGRFRRSLRQGNLRGHGAKTPSLSCVTNWETFRWKKMAGLFMRLYELAFSKRPRVGCINTNVECCVPTTGPLHQQQAHCTHHRPTAPTTPIAPMTEKTLGDRRSNACIAMLVRWIPPSCCRQPQW